MLSREYLINRGTCCGLGCLMCPYEPKHIKGVTKVMRKLINCFKEPLGTVSFDLILV